MLSGSFSGVHFSLFKVCVFLLPLVLDSGKLQNDLQSDNSGGVSAFWLSQFKQDSSCLL